MLNEVTPKELNDELLKDGKLVVFVSQTTCMPCKSVEPLFAGLQDKLNVVKVNLTNSPELVDGLNIMGTPTILVYEDGVEVNRFSGKDQSMSAFAQLS